MDVEEQALDLEDLVRELLSGLGGIGTLRPGERAMQVAELKACALEMVDHVAEVTEFTANLHEEFDLRVDVGLGAERAGIAQDFDRLRRGFVADGKLQRVASRRNAESNAGFANAPDDERTPAFFCSFGVSTSKTTLRGSETN